MTRAAFRNTAPRRGVIEALKRDATRLRALGEVGPVLLSFMCDPYQPLEEELAVTRKAIHILGAAGMGVRILTKNPRLAVERDLNVFQYYAGKGGIDFGVTCLFTSDHDRQVWEPNAGPVADRLAALDRAKQAGLSTWLSVEPVIDPGQAVAVIGLAFGVADRIMVGKLNHGGEREAAIDWRAFLVEVLAYLAERPEQAYYIKDALWRYADESIRGRYTKSREAMR